jgi:hypothetical protein
MTCRNDVFSSAWWSVRLPAGWFAKAEQHGATLSRSPGFGTLQISSARKDTAITVDDLTGFAVERVGSKADLEPVSFGAFSGFQYSRTGEHQYWREWWLKCGSLMIYATYVAPEDKTGKQSHEELADVGAILKSLAER